MGKYPFTPIEEFSIPIAHALIVRRDVRFEDVDTIMTHPQVLAQCRNNLNHKYPHLKQISGDGDLIDHSNVAKHLAEGKLPKTVATMGSKVLAEIYNLKVVEEGLQDLSENCTTFLWVSR
jgi:prephenate dehydratase